MGCLGLVRRVSANDGNVRRNSTTILLFLALFTGLAMTACSNTSDSPPEPSATALATSSAPTTVVVVPTTEPSPTVPPTVNPTAAVPPPPAPTATKQPEPTATVRPTATTVPTPGPTSTPAPPTATPFPLGGEFFLNLIEPGELDVFAENSSLLIAGQTRVDAVVTVNDDIVSPDADGMFEHTVSLEEGINIIEVVGSVSSDEQKSYVITVVYLP